MKNKAVFLLVGSALALCVALVLALQAAQLWQQRQQLLAQCAMQHKQIAQSKSFAQKHSDYASFARRQQQRLAQLEGKLSAQRNVNKALQRLQSLAAAQKLELVSVELVSDKAISKQITSKAQAVKLIAQGDFFSALRWLRQVERAGFKVHTYTLQAAENSAQILQLALIIKL